MPAAIANRFEWDVESTGNCPTCARTVIVRSAHIPSVVNDDSCGVHSRPYHSCVIACVMQVREEHAMGHDSGDAFAYICMPAAIASRFRTRSSGT